MEQKGLKIFVVEDNEWYNRLLVHNLELNPDYEIVSFLNGKDCIEHLNDEPDIITLDYRLPDFTGFEVLKKIKETNEDIEVILISEQDDIKVVVELLKHGAFDYILKSEDIRERLLNAVANLRNRISMRKELTELKKEVQQKYDFQKTIIGNSQAIKSVYDLISKATKTNITVTITGETGTGKELVAKAVHYNSKHKDKPFVPINVAAVPSELIESELFGHEKGSFTGASFRRIGKFEEAHGGTLFLDEVTEMEMSFQTKLLRALQEREIIRVGSNKPVKIECRIIVASNKNLLDEVKNGNFRQDLYYRLIGLPIHLPPLRERDKDILVLAKHFVDQFCSENELQAKTISSAAQKKLLFYNYPGNIRELKSIADLAVTLCSGDEIQPDDIVLHTAGETGEILSEELTLREYEKKIVQAYLKKYENNIKLVAEKLDIGQSTIYRMLKEE
ncbi:MAG: sigma-54-dependent Fis family transcriptional regulator [Bacteroidales bacterium]|nr:sigma-54-dependent Fis family transcriptional regulator [Bacteroidales bacterium]MBN2821126.1 sigma-54-dependent Fis family transcriptional regulator [Bacteroidales bacterium]